MNQKKRRVLSRSKFPIQTFVALAAAIAAIPFSIVAAQSAATANGWQMATPEEVGIDSAQLAEM